MISSGKSSYYLGLKNIFPICTIFSNLNKPLFGTSTPETSFSLEASRQILSSLDSKGSSQIFVKTTATVQPIASLNTMFPFFPQPNTSGFGATPANQSTFGSNIFGEQKTTDFGFDTPNQQLNHFGQSDQPQSSLSQPSGSANLFDSSSGFGSSTVGTGTTIKFNPVTGTDTMQKLDVTTNINTKHHCITCMEEYEEKSLEELRLEDYQGNRKGPQSQFGTTPFGNTSSMFGQTTENKSTFGQSTSFGQIGGTAFGQQTQPFGLGTQQTTSNNIFGKPRAFGGTRSTGIGFGRFNNSIANRFGANQNKPFAASSGAPLFGSTQTQQQSTPFGSNLFAQNTQNTTGNFFNKPAQTTFDTGDLVTIKPLQPLQAIYFSNQNQYLV